MKRKLLALVFLAGSSLFAAPRVHVGIGIGGYYQPPPVVTYAPCGPGYTWVAGYCYPVEPYYYYGYHHHWRPYGGVYFSFHGHHHGHVRHHGRGRR